MNKEKSKKENMEFRELYAFLSGYYQGVCFKKINDMYSLSKEELIVLRDEVTEKVKKIKNRSSKELANKIVTGLGLNDEKNTTKP